MAAAFSSSIRVPGTTPSTPLTASTPTPTPTPTPTSAVTFSTSTAFATISVEPLLGAEAAPQLATVTFHHGKPSKTDTEAYLNSLALVLNVHVTPERPCVLLFDASRLKASDGLHLASFGSDHSAFNKAYKARTDAVVRAFFVVVTQAPLRKLMEWIMAASTSASTSASSASTVKTPVYTFGTCADALNAIRSTARESSPSLSSSSPSVVLGSPVATKPVALATRTASSGVGGAATLSPSELFTVALSALDHDEEDDGVDKDD